VNQWDNLDGTIERGYGGRSIFWENDHARADLTRVADYGRLLASLGINAAPSTTSTPIRAAHARSTRRKIARIADACVPGACAWPFRWISAVRKSIGGSTPSIRSTRASPPGGKPRRRAVRRHPRPRRHRDEGRFRRPRGALRYNRTHADAANVVARALAPHGGLLFYRGFVYDHHMDWRNLKNDRARAAYDNFHDLDGQFDDNVVIQIKNGPIDFQVREPASPLFGALEKTNQAIELQITQEYFGQARHTVFWCPHVERTLDFDMHARGGRFHAVKALVPARPFIVPPADFVGVVNVGLDENWFGNHLSQANLYGFGRLAWNPDLSRRRSPTNGRASRSATIRRSTRPSRRFSSLLAHLRELHRPAGLQTLTDITGNHYGVNVEAPSATAGDSGIAPTKKASAWTAPCHRHRLHRPISARGRRAC
jgi:alpha-glucuronidase